MSTMNPNDSATPSINSGGIVWPAPTAWPRVMSWATTSLAGTPSASANSVTEAPDGTDTMSSSTSGSGAGSAATSSSASDFCLGLCLDHLRLIAGDGETEELRRLVIEPGGGGLDFDPQVMGLREQLFRVDPQVLGQLVNPHARNPLFALVIRVVGCHRILIVGYGHVGVNCFLDRHLVCCSFHP